MYLIVCKVTNIMVTLTSRWDYSSLKTKIASSLIAPHLISKYYRSAEYHLYVHEDANAT